MTTGRRTAELTQHKKAAFIAAFADVGTITHAAREAGIHRHTHYAWMEADEQYAVAFRAAEKAAAENLEREARRRAYEGVDEPVYQGGKEVGRIRKYSDTLLIFLLKGALPSKYRERVEITTDVNAEVRRLAAELGLDEAEVMAEAQAILSARR